MNKGKLFFFAMMGMLFVIAPQASAQSKRSREARAKKKTLHSEQVVSVTAEDIKEVKTFDVKAKRSATVDLVNKGIKYLAEHAEDDTFHAFSHDPDFVRGDLYLFVFDVEGVCLAHGQQSELIWQNLYNLKDAFGVYVIQAIINEALKPKRQGWATYQWRNATKISYVRQVKKDGQTYIVGAGYYPHSKDDAVANLVQSAVALFNKDVSKGLPSYISFGLMGYPGGRFSLGDLYIYALDFDGNVVAHGERFGAIGSNELDYQDAEGTFVHKEIIRRLRETNQGVWIEYVSKGAPKRAYAEKVVGKDGTQYFIACGYYPDADRNKAVQLVQRGFQYMKRHGETQASREFSKKKRKSDFVYGDLFLVVFNLDGTCVAHGGNEQFIGINLINAQDQAGFYYIKELIRKAKEGGGWVDYKINNSFISMYVEKIDVGLKSYFIGCGVYPISKYETMLLLVRSGAGYLKSNDSKKVFASFVSRDGKFIRGDLGLFVFDDSGICYMHEDNTSLIWKNLIDEKDDDGRLYVKEMIEAGTKGPSTMVYRSHKMLKTVYVEPVEKEGNMYIVGSEFYH